jgi:hypothetical protein
MLANGLSAALEKILDKWVFRPGLLRVHGAALDVNFHAKISRIRRPGAPPGFTRSSSGLFLPLRELVACHNIVVNQGLDDILDVMLSAGTQDTTWFLGLTANTPTFAAADTLASHAGWTEFTDYDEINRVAFVDGGVSGQSVDNAASPAEFTSSSDANSVGGSFLAGVNTGTAGRIYAGAAFGSNKAIDTGETVTVTATFTAANAA